MEMPKPGPAHEKLARLVGNWVGQEKISPSPWDPAGGVATGRVNNRVAVDGFAVVQDYEQERNGAVNMRGVGIFTYDAGGQCYKMHWTDSMGMGVAEYTGQFEGDKLVLSNKGPMGHSRATFDTGTPGAYRFVMEVSQDGSTWFTFMSGEYGLKG